MREDNTHWLAAAMHALRTSAFVLLLVLALQGLAPTAAAAQVKPEAVETFSIGGIGVQSPVPATANRTLVPVGRTVGIKLFSDGVLIVGLSEIPTDCGTVAPARDCGLKEGDIITHINSSEVDTIEQVQTILQELSGEPMQIRALRGEKMMQLSTQAVACSTDGAYKLGAWIRDSMAGIGTMTFYDPATGLFGALGHGISDVDTMQLMPLQSGAIMPASVTDVKKGAVGAPGELHGAFQTSRDLGALRANTSSGIFGTLDDPSSFDLGAALPIAARKEVKLGKATILSNVDGETVCEYTVEITKAYPYTANDTRDLMLKITDPRLLETTGGIVQGMSGSPILQDGKIIGAVTHVLVNDPTSGYGILAERMLSAASAQNTLKAS